MVEKKSRWIARLKEVANSRWFLDEVMFLFGSHFGVFKGDYEFATKLLLLYLFLRVLFSPSGTPKK